MAKKAPKRHFKTLEALDKNRQLLLGLPIRRTTSTIPFGYKLSEDGLYIEPIDSELYALYKAYEYLRSSTLEDVCEWLYKATGRKLTTAGFQKLIFYRRPVKELLLPLHERQRIYNTAPSPEEKAQSV